jgi:hypothetical protein
LELDLSAPVLLQPEDLLPLSPAESVLPVRKAPVEWEALAWPGLTESAASPKPATEKLPAESLE